jgi:hypothetical protein
MDSIRIARLPQAAFRPIRSPRTSSNRRILIASVFLALAFLPVPVQAGSLVVALDNVTGPTAGAGSFEVLLTNTDLSGGQSSDVASFSFQLSLPSSSGIQFTDATTATVSAPYIFQGTGGASVDPTFMLSLDSFPNTSFSGSDTEFTFPSIAVAPGATLGLGFISYTVAPQAPPGDVQIMFGSSGTSLSDASGSAIPFNTDARNGVIHIAVPEPSALVIASSGILVLLLAGFAKRQALSH